MPTEFALLTVHEVTGAVIDREAGRLIPGGVLLVHDASGVLQYVDPFGRTVASVFASRPLGVRTHVDALVIGGTGDCAWWTEVTVPYGDAGDGVGLASALARACGGRIAEWR